VLAMLGLMVLWVAVRGWRRWRANAYRRAALRALREAESLAAIAEVLKRAALTAANRSQVASLSGSSWLDWLEKTGGCPVPPAVAQALTVGIFAKPKDGNIAELAAFAAEWIRSHQVDPREGANTMGRQGTDPC